MSGTSNCYFEELELEFQVSLETAMLIGKQKTQLGPELVLLLRAFLENFNRQCIISISNTTNSSPSLIIISPECQSALRTCLQVLVTINPPGNDQFLMYLLSVTKTLQSNVMIQVILPFFPKFSEMITSTHTDGLFDKSSIEAEKESQINDQIIFLLHSILQRDSLSSVDIIIPVLNCLASLPMNHDRDRQKALKIALESLHNVQSCDLPCCIRCLLQLVSSQQDAVDVISSLRSELNSRDCLQEPKLRNILEIIHVQFSSQMKRSKVQSAYLSVLEQDAGRDIKMHHSSFLDCFVLLLSFKCTELKERAGNIIYALLDLNIFPFETWMKLLSSVSGNGCQSTNLNYTTLEDVSGALVQFSFFLLLSPTRVKQNQGTRLSIENCIVSSYSYMHKNDQRNLLQGLLHLSETSSTPGNEIGEALSNKYNRNNLKRKRSDITCNTNNIIPQSVNIVIRKFSEVHPHDLVPYCEAILRLLKVVEYNATNNTGSLQDICYVLFHLADSQYVTKKEFTEGRTSLDTGLMDCIQGLIFSCHPPTDLSNQYTIRGIMLATVLLQSESFGRKHGETLRAWICKIVLPKSRRMTQPDIGYHCLRFLVQWKESYGTFEDLFDSVAMILSNAGLIQKKPLRDTSSVFAFIDISKTKSLSLTVFCVKFFLQRVELHSPDRWLICTNWIVDLVDIYYKGVKAKKNSFAPGRWIQAPIEFPIIEITKDESSKLNATNLFLNRLLCQFNYSMHHRHDISDAVDSVACSSYEVLVEVRTTLLRFRFALLVAWSISCVLLSNVYNDNYDELFGPGSTFGMIKIQLNKIYDLQEKGDVLDVFLESLAQTINRRKPKPVQGKVINDPKQYDGMSVLEGSKNREIDKESEITLVKNFWSEMINSNHFIRFEVLWHCLMSESLHKNLLNLFDDLEEGNLLPVFGRFSETVEGAGVGKSTFNFCVTESLQILRILPKLRESIRIINMSEEDNDPENLYNLLNPLAALYMRLLSTIYSRCQMHITPSQNSFDVCLLWLRDGKAIKIETERYSSTSKSDSIITAAVATYNEVLHRVSNPSIANHILDIVALLSAKGSNDVTNEAMCLNWKSLHTIYAFETDNHIECALPFVFLQAIRKIAWEKSSLLNQFEYELHFDKLDRIPSHGNKSNIIHLRQQILRHWGLLVSSISGLIRMTNDFSIMVSELSKFLQAPDSKTYFGDVEFAAPETRPEKMEKAAYISRIVGLQSYTCSYLLEWMVQLIYATILITIPTGEYFNTESKFGPYHHIHSLFNLFKRLIIVYYDNMLSFPKTTAVKVCLFLKESLQGVVGLLQRCITWRNAHPMIPVEARGKGLVDLGDFMFLQMLMESASALVVKTILSTCEKLKHSGMLRKPVILNLKTLAKRTQTTIKDMATLHNLKDFDPDNKAGESTYAAEDETKGFHEHF